MDTQSGISQQPLIGSSSNFKPKPVGPNQNVKPLAMEDDHQILNVKYLSNHLLDLPQILNLRLGDQTQIKNA